MSHCIRLADHIMKLARVWRACCVTCAICIATFNKGTPKFISKLGHGLSENIRPVPQPFRVWSRLKANSSTSDRRQMGLRRISRRDRLVVRRSVNYCGLVATVGVKYGIVSDYWGRTRKEADWIEIQLLVLCLPGSAEDNTIYLFLGWSHQGEWCERNM